jgi:methionyl-tRNA formyltransferase
MQVIQNQEDQGIAFVRNNIIFRSGDEQVIGIKIGDCFFGKSPRVVGKIINGLIYTLEGEIIGQCTQYAAPNEKFATKYGKRTPSDGGINGEWQKERIYNWVRALTNPYPGAFTFYKNTRLVIDEIKFCEIGYDSILPNGIILSVKPNIIVKTPNGLIEIIKFREDYGLDFSINEILK